MKALRTAGLLIGLLVLMVLFLVIIPNAKRGTGDSRCPSRDQQRVLSKSESGRAYHPSASAKHAVILSPSAGNETFEHKFDYSRLPITDIVPLKVLPAPNQLPVSQEDLQAAFEGSLRRTDKKKLFPIEDQTEIAVDVRSDGREVNLLICIDPDRAHRVPPGRYLGTIVWSSNQNISPGDEPLIRSEGIPVEITLHSIEYFPATLIALVGLILGLAVKLYNDMQNQRLIDPGRMNQLKFSGWIQLYMRESPTAFFVTLAGGIAGGAIPFWTFYIENPAFIGEFRDLLLLAVQVGAGTITGHALAGSIPAATQPSQLPAPKDETRRTVG
jgi:hypothetical protein